MSVTKFKYQKENSLYPEERVVFDLSTPEEMLTGIDLTEYPVEEQEAYACALEELMEQFKEDVTEIIGKYQYKTFRRDRIIK